MKIKVEHNVYDIDGNIFPSFLIINLKKGKKEKILKNRIFLYYIF